ncbi:MAG TPA: lipopolysaccharide heptosyltransferase II [Burkholderiales bacterium]|jgi:heptosyltransferase-2|nr:lipopolysaccharide heptosyltransferase II [Burkholderiales bacterium]
MSAPRLLIVAPNWLGDSLMAQPLLTRFKAKAPRIAIDVLAVPAVAPVFRRMAEVEQVYEADFRHGRFGLAERWRLGRQFAGRYSQAIILPNSWKSALVPFFASIDLRIGYIGESRYGLLNLPHRNPKRNAPRAPMARFYAQLSEAPGKSLGDELTQPCLISDPVRSIAAKVTLGLKPVERLVALCPGAEYGPAKRWPAEYFANVASKLKAMGATPIVLGSQADVPTGLTIEQLSHGAALNLCGKTTLDQAIDLIAGSTAVITNDSGLMHVAAALDVPQLALFGSSSPEHTPPLSEAARVIYLAVDCSPCYQRVCPLGHFKCMRELTPELVLENYVALTGAAA